MGSVINRPLRLKLFLYSLGTFIGARKVCFRSFTTSQFQYPFMETRIVLLSLFEGDLLIIIGPRLI